MENRPQKSLISTGTTSLVLIFVLLCLLTFSVLSLVSAQADLRLVKKSVQRTSDYYEAENAANDILLNIIQVLDKGLETGNETGFYQYLYDELNGVSGIAFDEKDMLSYQVPVDSHQFLSVKLTLSFEPFANRKHYQITAWNTDSGYNWTLDDSLSLPKELPAQKP